ncbi:amino acid ABC transporter permease [Ahrensia marina]|jgi:general L-amino acid transport system permease protein|uniref:amino acid ABC transporter permease n=1 Tax=Ahrensia marina TaxID=1514904 RepID=UPI0035CFC1B3
MTDTTSSAVNDRPTTSASFADAANFVPTEARPAPASIRPGPMTWLKENLFNTWYNALFTLVAIYALANWIPAAFDWFFTSALWEAAPADACDAVTGACWAFVYEKWRFILFGTYPFEQQWRPGAAVILFIGMVIISCFKPMWNKSLLVIWPVGLIVCWILLSGGIFGLDYVPNNLWGGLPITLMLAVIGCGLAFPISIALALGRRSKMPIIKAFCVGYIELIRGVPLITVLFMASVMFPLFMPEGITIDKLLRAQVAIIMFAAAYLAEVVRGGLQAIPKGQYEAADAMGLSYWQAMVFIILPQALKITIPPQVNTFIGMFKDTSLVLIVGIFDLMFTMRVAINDLEWRAFYIEGMVFVAILYFLFCYSMSKYSQWLEHELHRGHKRI